MGFWDKVSNIDRRWIYLMVALATFFPMIVVMQFPVELTPEAVQLYEAIDNLPDSSVVMLTFDYYPSAMAETRPMSIAALRHMFSKDMKVVTVSNIPLVGTDNCRRCDAVDSQGIWQRIWRGFCESRLSSQLCSGYAWSGRFYRSDIQSRFYRDAS